MCDICNGYPGCPVCSPIEHSETCPICDGNGALYFTELDGQVTYEKWAQTDESERDMDVCENCEGEGKVWS